MAEGQHGNQAAGARRGNATAGEHAAAFACGAQRRPRQRHGLASRATNSAEQCDAAMRGSHVHARYASVPAKWLLMPWMMMYLLACDVATQPACR